MLDHAVRLVMSIDFLDAFSQLPKQIQKECSLDVVMNGAMIDVESMK